VPFAKDVQTVVEKEGLRRVVILGNSLGGPVALQATRLMPKRAMAVIAVDSLQSLAQKPPANWAKEQAKAFRDDFTPTMKKMVRALLHPDTDPKLYAWVEKQMLDNQPETAASIMESLGTYDFTAPLKGLLIPIRCINGDLFPTDIEANRQVYRDFDAVVLKHMGHYPMLENPELFNQTLTRVLKDLAEKK